MSKYPVVLAGMTVTATLLDSMLPDIVVKATAETVTSSTTLQNDDELFSAVAANATYDVLLHLLHDSDATAAGDVKFTFNGPAGATMNWGMIGAHINETSSTTVTAVTMPSRVINETNTVGGGDSTGTYCIAHGVLTTSGTAGTLRLQWAQGTSNAVASTVRAGSVLVVRRTA